jgi:succinyl-CoA synthetase alpha subunit
MNCSTEEPRIEQSEETLFRTGDETMLYTVIRENSYQDSINLMLLTNKISALPGVTETQIMMGTDANKDIFKSAGLLTAEAQAANPSDMMIVLNAESADTVQLALEEIEQSLNDISSKKSASKTQEVHNWTAALEASPDANIALISIPGVYAASEIENALNNGLHAFVFSDNVSEVDEVRLKKLAHEKGLLVMGPDCGTAIISGVPFAFTNHVRSGNIGLVGASGTGLQEVTTIIDRLGGGVCHAIGTGGHDLSEAVGALTMQDALIGLAGYDPASVLVVISKPPAQAVRDEVVEILHSIDKPVVALFLGEVPTEHSGNVYFAHTLEETARLAVDLAAGRAVQPRYVSEPQNAVSATLPADKRIVGLYSGGTLASEAAMLIKEALPSENSGKKEHGFVMQSERIEIIDLGDDVYTQGKPHPMIDPTTRIHFIGEVAAKPQTGVVLLDIVLGEGSSPDMAGVLVPAITEALDAAKEQNRPLYFVATICGTTTDPQNYAQQKSILEAAGVLVEESNVQATRLALQLIGSDSQIEPEKAVTPYQGKTVTLPEVSPAVAQLLNTQPRVLNIGVAGFAEAIGNVVQFDWKPTAGGNLKLFRLLSEFRKRETLQAENRVIIDGYKDAAPYLMDVVQAITVIPELDSKVLLHAGPPIAYGDMTGPMQGSCVGAALFEGWATDEASARELLAGGGVKFMPCHSVRAVGPMGGITSAHMPVLVVENKLAGNRAFCTMNEGIGKVLRFGAFDEEVVTRLEWMRDSLGPVLSQALQTIDGGLNLGVIIAKAITMGDEFHQRNIAASLLFLKEVTPAIVSLPLDEAKKKSVIEFLAKTDQFFLNIMMATGKAIVDGARTYEHGTVVTTMTRNGKDFGIRVSALGDEWFTAPVNTPQGLFFTGFSQDDANPDIGDSAITETVGVGAMSMIAAPGVVRFVGAGGFEDALQTSNDMAEICIAHNPNWTIPTWDFKGAPLGIDICKVVETGITPLINTGIAHKNAGVGQVGAGTVHAPLACFEKALVAYGKKMGIDADNL